MDVVKVNWVDGSFPVQAEGVLSSMGKDTPLYFRGSGSTGDWSLSLDGVIKVVGKVEPELLDEKTVNEIIKKAVAEWSEGEYFAFIPSYVKSVWFGSYDAVIVCDKLFQKEVGQEMADWSDYTFSKASTAGLENGLIRMFYK